MRGIITANGGLVLGNGGLIVAQRYASFRSMYRFTFVRRLVLAGPSQYVNSGERRKACKPQHIKYNRWSAGFY